METNTATATLRSTAMQNVIDSLTECAAYDHKRNYHKLHIWRDGTVSWSECINKSDDIIDSRAKGFAAVKSVACVGTGSTDCNCDYCNEVYNEQAETIAKEEGREYDRSAKYTDRAEAISEAISNSDLGDMEAGMLARFEEIPVGYFDDEED